MADAARLQILIAGCARGEQPALAELYRSTAPHLFALATRMLRRRDLAEEVIQECFVSVWDNAHRYAADEGQVMTWMTRIVRNRCIDVLRRPDREQADPDGLITDAWADDAPGPLARLQSSREGARLAECLKQLVGQQRMAIALSFFEDLSHSEIATRMTAPLGSVKSWVRRGLERLKGCLG